MYINVCNVMQPLLRQNGRIIRKSYFGGGLIIFRAVAIMCIGSDNFTHQSRFLNVGAANAITKSDEVIIFIVVNTPTDWTVYPQHCVYREH